MTQPPPAPGSPPGEPERPAPPAPPVAAPPPVAPPPVAPASPVAPPPVAAPLPPPAAPGSASVVAADAAAAAAAVSARARSFLGGLDSGGWRPTVIFAAVLAAVVFGTQLVNAAVPVPGEDPNGPNGPIGPVGTPVSVTDRVRVVPAAGFVEEKRFEGTLAGVRLTRGDVSVDVRVTTFSQGAGPLLAAYLREILQPDTSSLSVTSENTAVIGGRYQAVTATYVGVFNGVSSPLEGQLTGVVFTDGLAIVFDAWAPEGRLTTALTEVRQIVDSLEVSQ